MNETEVKLPSGGTAWITSTISHAQAKVLELHQLRLSRLMGNVRQPDNTFTSDWRPDLTEEDLDRRDALMQQTSELQIRTLTKRWSGVADIDGEPLSFPDDIDRMQQVDFLALFTAATARGDAEGNGSGPSNSGSEAAESPTTPKS